MELRPIRPDDRDLLDAFHKRQSAESIYFRFFQHRPELTDAELDHFTQVDYVDRMAFVALLSTELVAVARYERPPTVERPEVAFFVDDRHHGRGLATLLLEYLAAAGRHHGFTSFTATVLPENYAMLGVFRRAGFGVATRFEDGLIGVDLDIAVTTESSDAIADRQARARSRSVARLLQPTSVAVVGAGRRPASIGHQLVRNLVDGGFSGPIYPVNRAVEGSRSELVGRPVSPSLTAIDEPIDLVVVAVPAAEVASVVDDAIAVGASGLLVVSAGFGEAGAVGRARQDELVAAARSNGMRLIGPNAFGMVNTAPDVALHALFLPVRPAPGSVAMVSQSGPLGAAVLEHLGTAGIGLSSFLAPGNRADVSVNDVLEYWATDEATTVVLLYVENYGNLRTFARSARAVSVDKPIVTVRPADDDLLDLLDQSGVVVVDDVAEMADVARLAADQPLPAGRRVVVVSNASSVARLAVAACRRSGLDVVVPAAVVSGDRGDAVLMGDVEETVIDGDDEELDYERALVAAAVSAEVDAVLVALVPTLELGFDRLARLLARVDRSIAKPVVATGLVGADRLTVPGLPLFQFPEEAARALGHLADYADWLRTDGASPLAVTDDEVVAVRASIGPIVDGLLEAEDGDERRLTMQSPDIEPLLAGLELPVAPWRLIADPADLDPAATDLGFPVALKAKEVGQRRVGEAGGAAIDLHDRDQLRAAFDRMSASLGPAMLPAVVQRMVPSTANVRIELIQNADVGAFVRLGLGGAVGSSLPTIQRRYLPLGVGEARAAVEAMGSTIAMTEADTAALTDIVRRLAVMAAAVPELANVELDPVLLAGADTAAGDVTIALRPIPSDPLAGVRRL